MKKFKFRMQPILEIRERKLNDERLKLTSLENTLKSQIDILNEMLYRQEKIFKELELLQSSEMMEIDRICNYRAFLKTIAMDIQMQNELIRRTQIQIEDQKKEVTKAYQDLKTIENLKEKQEKEHYKHFEVLEAKEIDDIAITRYRHNK